MASQPTPAMIEAEERAQESIAKLRVTLARLDLIDAWRMEIVRELAHESRALANARGVPFLRLEHVRKECA